MAEKTTVMVLKVDLQCPCCYKKVKKILCKFPQIRNQVYDEKANTVTITVVCCDPEKFRDKLCCKGCKVIKSIEIKEPEKPKPKPKPKEPEKQKPPAPAPTPAPAPAPAPAPKPTPAPAPAPPKDVPKPAPPPKAPEPAPPPKQPQPHPMPVFPPCGCWPGPCYCPPPPFPVRTCCEECYHGHGGGPCYWNCPPRRPPCHDGCYDYCCRRGCHVSRCDYYFSEENSQSCSIM